MSSTAVIVAAATSSVSAAILIGLAGWAVRLDRHIHRLDGAVFGLDDEDGLVDHVVEHREVLLAEGLAEPGDD